MRMKKIYLGTNWKMHKNSADTKLYLQTLNEYIIDVDFEKVAIFVIPPYTSLSTVKKALKNSKLLYGAQNMHWQDEGAFTGEISPRMLKDFDIDLIELGHSERRQYYNENDIDLNRKVKAALKYNFTPLICVGEKEEDKKYGIGPEVIRKQLKIILHGVDGNALANLWIAYEPVWAIGEDGKPATPDYVKMIHGIIRDTIGELYNEEIAKEVPILYGGSVNENNAYLFLREENVNGLFIGRAAWEPKSFSRIIHQTIETFC